MSMVTVGMLADGWLHGIYIRQLAPLPVQYPLKPWTFPSSGSTICTNSHRVIPWTIFPALYVLYQLDVYTYSNSCYPLYLLMCQLPHGTGMEIQGELLLVG